MRGKCQFGVWRWVLTFNNCSTRVCAFPNQMNLEGLVYQLEITAYWAETPLEGRSRPNNNCFNHLQNRAHKVLSKSLYADVLRALSRVLFQPSWRKNAWWSRVTKPPVAGGEKRDCILRVSATHKKPKIPRFFTELHTIFTDLALGDSL